LGVNDARNAQQHQRHCHSSANNASGCAALELLNAIVVHFFISPYFRSRLSILGTVADVRLSSEFSRNPKNVRQNSTLSSPCRQTFCTISGVPQFMRDVRVPFRSSSGDGAFFARHGCSVLERFARYWRDPRYAYVFVGILRLSTRSRRATRPLPKQQFVTTFGAPSKLASSYFCKRTSLCLGRS